MTDQSALDKVKRALANSGLECKTIEEYPDIGFENSQRGYAIFVGGIVESFRENYLQTLSKVPKSYYIPSSRFHTKGYSYKIKPEKRDLLARRIMVKQAIDNLDTKIEESREEHEGGDYIIDTYYKISIENIVIGLFIKNSKGSRFPPGF